MAPRARRPPRRSAVAGAGRPAVGVRDRGHDREPEARATAAARTVRAREALERASDEARAGSPARRRERAARLARRALALELDARAAVAQRVVDEVADRLLEPQRIGSTSSSGAARSARAPERLPAARSALHRVEHAPSRRAALDRIGRRPWSERAITSRSSASCTSRSVSSAAERSAASSSSRLRPPRSASSSSALRIASGVRSSWLASATNVRSRANAASSRASITLSVSPSRPISSSAGGDRQARARRGGLDVGGAPAHPLHRRAARPQPRRSRPARRAAARSGRRSAAAPARLRSASLRSSTGVPTTTTSRRPSARTGVASRRTGSSAPAAARGRRRSCRAARAQIAAAQQRRVAHGRRAVEHRAGPSRIWARFSPCSVSGLRPDSARPESACWTSVATSPARERSPWSIAASSSAPSRDVQEQPRRREQDRHRARERERDPNAHGQAGDPRHQPDASALVAAV